jgi:hypothetical protein
MCYKPFCLFINLEEDENGIQTIKHYRYDTNMELKVFLVEIKSPKYSDITGRISGEDIF